MKTDPLHPSSEELFAYRDGELLPEKRAIIEAHVMGCSVCRSFIDQVSSLESELRQSPDSAPEGYLERLHETVRARIAVAASVDPAGRPAPAGDASGRELRRRASGPRERRTGDRESDPERGRVKEAPVLPWAAVISTVSAAAAVLVVVAILIKQGPYRRMITPKAKPAPERSAPAAEGKRERGARGGAGEREVTLGAAREETGSGAAGQKAPGTAPEESAERLKQEPSPASTKLDEGAKDQLDKKVADQVAARTEPPGEEGGIALERLRALRGAPSAQDLQQKPKASANEPRAQRFDEAAAQTAGYAAILARFHLPPLWDGARVSPEALANAEPELRSLYVSGTAGSDSARVRLYLAEAVRLRYAPGDSTMYDEIRRHYRRAIELAGPDSETARVAEDRLRTLER